MSSKITLHKDRCPLEATATDGVSTGTIKVKDEEEFIQQMVDEYMGGFEAVKLKKTLLHISKYSHVNKITIKEKRDKQNTR